VTLFDYDTKIARRDELQQQMNAADFWNDQEKAKKVIDQYKLLKAQTEGLEAVIADFEDAKVGYELAREADDAELLVETDEKLHELNQRMERVELQSLLSGKHDHRDCFVSIHSGDGGTEADDWASILERMYLYYWERAGWKIEEISKTHGTEVGVSEVTYHVKGPMAYGYMLMKVW
jgi:peptide chain release factor 2